MPSATPPSHRQGFFNRLEETLIAVLLGVMTIMTFANVVARYGFNSNIFYALEATVFLFAWLVLLGASYGFKHNLHLGVDALVGKASVMWKRRLGLVVVAVCLIYTLLLLKGAWDYWAPFANLPPTAGRWWPTGFVDKFRDQGWYETQDIPVPFFLEWLKYAFNEGVAYEKLPKVVPYAVLPVATLLLSIRIIQVGICVWRGQQALLIVSHETEEEIAQMPVDKSDQELR